MKKLIKFNFSPEKPAFEVVGDKIIQITAPSSNKTTTVKISPQILEYEESNDQDGMMVRNVSVTSETPETISLKFDLEQNKTQEIEVSGKLHKLTLMDIGLEKFDGQDFPYFEFFIEEAE